MEDPTTSLEYLLHTFHRMHHVCMRIELEKRGVPEIGNPAILFILRHAVDGRPVTQREIADKLGVSPPTVAVAVKRMTQAGLLQKQADECDLRKTWISLTDRGKRFTDSCLAAKQEIYQQIVAGFTPEETKAMRGYYLRMIGNMQGLGCRRPTFLQELPNQWTREGDGPACTGEAIGKL